MPAERHGGTPQLNDISFQFPSYPLLSQPEQIRPGSLCNASSVPSSCVKKYCACTHVLQVELHSVVELVFVSEGKLNF